MAKKAKAVIESFEIDDVDDESGPIPAGQLGDWKEVLPKEVQDAVDKYIDAMRESNAMREQKNAAKEACIEAMSNHEIERVRIDEGGKYLVCESVMRLKTESAKGQGDDSDDD